MALRHFLKLLVPLSILWSLAVYADNQSSIKQPPTSQSTARDYLTIPLTRDSGKRFTLSDYTGRKPVYLKIWASWCVPCRKQMPHFQGCFEQYGDSVEVLAINLGLNDSWEDIDAVVKEFGLTLPMASDDSGKLSNAFNNHAAPLHILLDRHGNIVHRDHEPTAELEEKLQLLATGQDDQLIALAMTEQLESGETLQFDSDKPQALFFLSTWCDWYLKESRPAMSANCKQAQRAVNELALRFPRYQWHGISTRLWTVEKQLEVYRQRYAVQHPLQIDHSNRTFVRFGIQQIPTLVVINGDKELLRITSFDQPGKISKQLNALTMD